MCVYIYTHIHIDRELWLTLIKKYRQFKNTKCHIRIDKTGYRKRIGIFYLS